MLRWAARLRGPRTTGTYCHRAVAVRNCAYCFGFDSDHSDRADVHIFNTVSLAWRKLTPGRGQRHLAVPCWLRGYTAVLVGDTVYLWGGFTLFTFTYNTCNTRVFRQEYKKLYAFDVEKNTWVKPQVSGTVPEWRHGHSACVLGKVVYIHGGRNQSGSWFTNETLTLDTSTMVWSLITARRSQPPASSGHSAAIIGTKMIVFGGRWFDGLYNTTTRLFDTDTMLWTHTPSTLLRQYEDRWWHSYFTYNGEIHTWYIYQRPSCNELWKFNPKTFSWKTVKLKGEGPPCSGINKRCCCMVGDHVVVFGGSSDDLFVLDLSPSLKMLCKLGVVRYGLHHSELPHNVRRELASMR